MSVNATPLVFVNGQAIKIDEEGKTFDDIAADITKLIEEGLKEDKEDKKDK